MRLHKKYIKILLSGLLLPWLLTGCRDDNFDGVAQESPEMPLGDYVVAFDLKWDGDAGTRAGGDLEDGIHDEHEIRDTGLYALFFGKDNSLVRVLTLRTGHYDDNGNEVTEENTAEGKYFATYSVKRSEIKPASCLLLINASDEVVSRFLSSDKTYSINDVLAMTWDAGTDARKIGHVNDEGESNTNDYTYLTMTNATYVAEDGTIACAVPVDVKTHFIPEEWLVDVNPYDPWDGVTVKDDNGDNVNLWERVLEIPVERMLAKFTLKIDADKEAQYDEATQTFTPLENDMVVFTELDRHGNHLYDNKTYSYKVKVVGWGVNALETKTNLYKKVTAGSNYFTGWSDPSNLRTYWAEDSHYAFSKDYPLQFRKALDNPKLKYYDDLEERGVNMLQNYSYTDLNNGLDSPVFAPENTYDNSNNYSEWLAYYDPERMHVLTGSHILICTELLTNMENGVDFKKGDFFRDRNGVWYLNEEQLFYSMIQTLSNEFKSQSEMQFYYKDWNEPKLYSTSEDVGKTIILDTEGEWFMYYQDEKIDITNYQEIYKKLKQADNGCKATAKSYITNSDGQRIIWFDDISIRDAEGNLIQRCTIDGIDNRGHTIKTHLGPLDHNHHKSLLYEWLGVVDHFREGRMYYAAPLQNVSANNYGSVRNTWYKMSLGNINRLGTPVDDPLEPIVPNGSMKAYQLTFNVKIMDWHNIELDIPSNFLP